jgi:hypothetical protein
LPEIRSIFSVIEFLVPKRTRAKCTGRTIVQLLKRSDLGIELALNVQEFLYGEENAVDELGRRMKSALCGLEPIYIDSQAFDF